MITDRMKLYSNTIKNMMINDWMKLYSIENLNTLNTTRILMVLHKLNPS